VIGSLGKLTVKNSNFTGNYANDNGGAISNEGDLTVKHTNFTSNSVGWSTRGWTQSGGAIWNT
jgi:predicted outer membrane repeat protein